MSGVQFPPYRVKLVKTGGPGVEASNSVLEIELRGAYGYRDLLKIWKSHCRECGLYVQAVCSGINAINGRATISGTEADLTGAVCGVKRPA